MSCRDLQGCRWYASAHAYEDAQLAIDGQDPNQLRRGQGRRFRSHLSMIVSRMVNKIVTIPCLKDHKSAGVTIALKNMSHGMNNNVARSHISLRQDYRLGGAQSGPNQCNTFIPTAVNQRPLREKAVLHICDGLVGVYEGGPGCWNRTWGTWQAKSLMFATDPVAMDTLR